MINKDVLYEHCIELVKLELESLESSGVVPIGSISKDKIGKYAQELSKIAVEEVLEEGITSIDDYSVYESDEIMVRAIDLIIEGE